MEKYIDYLVKWLQDKLLETGCKGYIVGVSGGIDSAVVANLIKKACPDNSLGLIMPCHSIDLDVKHGKLVCEEIDLKYDVIDLSNTFDTLMDVIDDDIKENESFKMAKANSKARLRMTTLYTVAQNYNYLVVGTDNACEWYTGYFTKYGDGGVDLVPIIHLLKSEVYEIAKILNVNEAIINKAPSAGLFENQTDEKELQFTYDQLESYMNGHKVDEVVEKRINYLHSISEHKRNLAYKPECKKEDII
ncbi:MAG: NAD(+) synthase [Bacilli bacterium]|jgi:NAD+ synthase|nr:NAD(+) synthase [Bacilli bacterium]